MRYSEVDDVRNLQVEGFSEYSMMIEQPVDVAEFPSSRDVTGAGGCQYYRHAGVVGYFSSAGSDHRYPRFRRRQHNSRTLTAGTSPAIGDVRA